MKLKGLGIISFLCVCKAAAADVAAENTAAALASTEATSESLVHSVVVSAAGEGEGNKNAVEKDQIGVGEAATVSDAAANDKVEASAKDAAESEPAEMNAHHEEEEHHDGQFHELTEAFEIMDENRDGVLQKEEIITAIARSAHHIDIPPEDYADKLMPEEAVGNADGNQTKTLLFDMDRFTEMIKKASSEETKEGEVPSFNQQMSHLASDVLASYYVHEEEPPYAPSTEEWYNPHNMTYDELEYHLYEWEEDAVGHVTEYLDWEVFERMRNQGDDWYKEDEEHAQEEEEEKKHTTLKEQQHHDDGSKTKVEMRKSNTNHYLNLSNDVAHVVEFYAPWCPHCQHFKWEYIEIAKETKRRATATPGTFIFLHTTALFLPLFHLI
jgi:thiol-disulfide isomerase/thioredoxin